ncbi:MAG: hypothetical protein IPG74_03155 [Flavobacteriales bacterium]|nr:hypothetical protein [Flavobacteriales bacterium]
MPLADKPGPAPRKRLRRWQRVLLRTILWLVLLPPVLLGVLVLLVYVPPIQDLLRSKGVSYLEGKIGSRVSLDHFALRYPVGVSLEGLMVFDEGGDTLLYAGELRSSLALVPLSTAASSLRTAPSTSAISSALLRRIRRWSKKRSRTALPPCPSPHPVWTSPMCASTWNWREVAS